MTELLDYRPPTATRVYAADGTPIGEFYVERRYLVPHRPRSPRTCGAPSSPPRTRTSTSIAGVDPAGIARALIANLRTRRDRPGRQHDHPAGREAAPALAGAQLRAQGEGDDPRARARVEALEGRDPLPLPEPHLLRRRDVRHRGRGARVLRRRRRARSPLAQAALLAGLPQAPSRYDPRRHPREAIARQRYVLDRMLAAGFITVEEHAAARDEPIEFAARKTDHVRRRALVRRPRPDACSRSEYGPEFAYPRAAGAHRPRPAPAGRRRGGAPRGAAHDRAPARRPEHAFATCRRTRSTAYLDRQRASRPREGPQQAVVTGVARAGDR